MIKKATKKIVQITKPELVKCRASQEFEANVITYVKPKSPIPPQPPIPPGPPGMPPWFKVWSQTTYQKQQPQWFKGWSKTFETNNNSRLDRIESDVSAIKTTLIEHGKSINKLDTKLTRVIKLNKLKS